MRAVVIALGCLAASISLPTLANGQSQIADPQVRDQLLWDGGCFGMKCTAPARIEQTRRNARFGE